MIPDSLASPETRRVPAPTDAAAPPRDLEPSNRRADGRPPPEEIQQRAVEILRQQQAPSLEVRSPKSEVRGQVENLSRQAAPSQPAAAEPGASPAADVRDPKSEVRNQKSEIAPEVIHSRSVQMGSQRLGVTAKLDLVEVRTGADDLFSAIEVCPVDYKAGAPREGDDGNELWDADKMQLGLQALILRENGYTCREGVIYYRATKQRVRLPITPELEAWVTENVARARAAAVAAIPPPLVNSPKCPRCSLVTVCLPDETRLLSTPVPSRPRTPGPYARQDLDG